MPSRVLKVIIEFLYTDEAPSVEGTWIYIGKIWFNNLPSPVIIHHTLCEPQLIKMTVFVAVCKLCALLLMPLDSKDLEFLGTVLSFADQVNGFSTELNLHYLYGIQVAVSATKLFCHLFIFCSF